MLHRDLKPSNIVLPSAGHAAVIIDFGHALSAHATRITENGMVLGSAAYMAPEQGAGLPLDERADLYALGVIVYQILTGTLPFDASSPGELLR